MKKRICIFTILPLIFVLAFSYAYSRENETASDDTMKTADQPVKQLQMSEAKAESLLQKRAEIFEEMGWIEGEYASETEAEIARKFTDYNDRHREIYVQYPSWMYYGKWDMNFFRPLVEFVFNPYNSITSRTASIERLGYLRDERAVPILKNALLYESLCAKDDKWLTTRKTIAQALFRCGAKDAAFREMVKINEAGISFIIHTSDPNDPKDLADTKIIPYLIEITELSDDWTRVKAAHELMHSGEIKFAREIAFDILAKLTDLKKFPEQEAFKEDPGYRIKGWAERILEMTGGAE